jgi:hypothetical protein
MSTQNDPHAEATLCGTHTEAIRQLLGAYPELRPFSPCAGHSTSS